MRIAQGGIYASWELFWVRVLRGEIFPEWELSGVKVELVGIVRDGKCQGGSIVQSKLSSW